MNFEKFVDLLKKILKESLKCFRGNLLLPPALNFLFFKAFFMQRIILHVDLDYFFAQAEELKNPALKGKPLVVGIYSGRTPDSGAVATCNYEARALGIHSGMPLAFAKKKASIETIFLPADKKAYVEISGKVMEILQSYCDSFEQVSIDEAYLDVSKKSNNSIQGGEKIALQIKAEIFEKEKLSCSVGIASSKIVAKIASAFKKPDGLTAVELGKEMDFLFPLPVSKISGVGPKTFELLKQNRVETVKQLFEFDFSKLKALLGEKKAILLKQYSEGIDESIVEETGRKQFSRIGTMKKDSNSFNEIFMFLQELSKELHLRILQEKVLFKTISIAGISTKLESFQRAKTLADETNSIKSIDENVSELLKKLLSEKPGHVFRRFGVSVSGLAEKPEKRNQKSLNDFV